MQQTTSAISLEHLEANRDIPELPRKVENRHDSAGSLFSISGVKEIVRSFISQLSSFDAASDDGIATREMIDNANVNYAVIEEDLRDKWEEAIRNLEGKTSEQQDEMLLYWSDVKDFFQKVLDWMQILFIKMIDLTNQGFLIEPDVLNQMYVKAIAAVQEAFPDLNADDDFESDENLFGSILGENPIESMLNDEYLFGSILDENPHGSPHNHWQSAAPPEADAEVLRLEDRIEQLQLDLDKSNEENRRLQDTVDQQVPELPPQPRRAFRNCAAAAACAENLRSITAEIDDVRNVDFETSTADHAETTRRNREKLKTIFHGIENRLTDVKNVTIENLEHLPPAQQDEVLGFWADATGFFKDLFGWLSNKIESVLSCIGQGVAYVAERISSACGAAVAAIRRFFD